MIEYMGQKRCYECGIIKGKSRFLYRSDLCYDCYFAFCKKSETEENRLKAQAITYFTNNGVKKELLTESEIKAKIMHIKLKRAIKGHKEVTNG